MEKISVGTILKCEDQLVANQIEQFLQRLDGCKVIYFTRNTTHQLYVVDSERAKRMFTGGNNE